ncbi:FkbM family methyltransferase [Actinokineospora sp. NBRC 105648]|uniref:FkbM family methyltransferase n=1 Tax=Actinokineospora sp. NBRC 105648 TaxID=3032206 RepID=UPI0024A24FB5|nr:FkbM family methyltransferase [Actinokineospora sp. NBRC 105648]GLZ39079.1 hypothetical protein Acsp05_27030 [Actinokineospora sp. NBRC 105648]
MSAEHPAVAAVLVRAGTAYVVPNPDTAPLLHRAVTTDLPDGLTWHEPSPDLLVAGVNRSETEFLHKEVWVGNAYLRHGVVLPAAAVVVDIGANIGMFSLLAGLSGARVIAVEPVTEAASAVAVNAALHGVDVTVVESAVGRSAGETAFTVYPRNTVMSGRHASIDDREVLRAYLATDPDVSDVDLTAMAADHLAAEVRRVPVTTVPDLLAGHGLSAVDLLKVDVEKAEWDVLAGIDAATWALVDQVAVEVHDLDGRLAVIVDLLLGKGFTVSHDRDPRLVGTPCHTVYGHRKTVHRTPAPPRAPVAWPTTRALAADLSVDRVVLVRDLADIPAAAPAAVSTGTVVLAEIWADLFGPDAVHPDADFFALGGNSLTAVRLVSRLEARLGEDVVAPDTVFTATRFQDLAAAIEAGLR